MQESKIAETKRFLVVTPVLNGVTYALECIQAVRTAFNTFDYLHVIVDGGSTDGTIETIEAVTDASLKLIVAPKTTMYQALNIGMKCAEADIFYQINIDDLVLPEAAEIADGSFRANPGMDVLVGSCLLLDLEAKMVRSKYFMKRQNEMLSLNLFLAQPSTFVRLATLRRIGGYNEDFKWASDTDLWLRLTSAGAKFVTIDDFLSIDRVHSAVARLSDRHFIELAVLRGHYNRKLRLKWLRAKWNYIKLAGRLFYGLFAGLGSGKSVVYEDDAPHRLLAFFFDGKSRVAIHCDAINDSFPISGYVSAFFNKNPRLSLSHKV